ncbi:MAG TPA: hypothetical protein VK506_13750 [Conexibacter sp.]|nr:hypothetical protein [Conexibacter sp.]
MDRPRRPARDLSRLAPPALAAALAAVYLIWQPPSLDLAAAEYRAWLFGHEGLGLWNNQWYGGHHLPGYSLLFPPLAWWLGPRVVGAIAVVAAAWLFERLAHEHYGERAWLGATWFAAGAATTLFSGRLTFALGLVPALASLRALQRGAAEDADRAGGAGQSFPRPRSRKRAVPATGPARQHGLWLGAALLLALLTPLASPVAALFLALAGTAYALGERRARGIAVAAAAMAPVAALSIAFPEGGIEPFVFSAYWPVLAFAAVALVLLPREERTLRIGVVLYALGCTAAFLIDTPLGGNVVRLGALCAGPLAALVLWPNRKLVLALLAPFLLWWQWNAAVDDVHTASGDPSVHAAYYAPLLDALDRAGARGGAAGRLEIPFTRLHWEARHVAPAMPLARGWERQMDLKVNPLFYGEQTDAPPLTATRYRTWLDETAVRWVAVPQDLRLDYSAQDEATLIAGGLPYLRPVWRNPDWRLYEVRDSMPLADPPARVTALGTDTVTLDVPRPATVRLRVRWTPYWAVVAGEACVEPDGEWTRLRVRRAGEVRLATRFAPGRIGARSPRCA